MKPMPAEYALPDDIASALASACEAAPWTKTHGGLLASLQAVRGFEALRSSAVRDHFSRHPSRILDGMATVAPAYRDWVRSEVAAHGNDARSVWVTHVGKPWTLTWSSFVLRYFWIQTGAHPWNGIQLEVAEEQEFAGGPVFRPERWNAPQDLQELLNPPDADTPKPVALAPGKYRLLEAIDMEAFFRLGQSLHIARLDRGAQRRVVVKPERGEAYETTMGKEAPEAYRQMWRVQRWFQDWAFSSAGRSGAVAGHHWAFHLSDWDSGTAMTGRVLDFVPVWSHRGRVAKIQNIHRLSDEALYGRLLALDKRTGGVPFGWYFYMLHGNLVPDGAGQRVLKAVQRGVLTLPDHDGRVLEAWALNSYGF